MKLSELITKLDDLKQGFAGVDPEVVVEDEDNNIEEIKQVLSSKDEKEIYIVLDAFFG